MRNNAVPIHLLSQITNYFHHSLVSVLATGTTGPKVAGSGPAEDGGFLWAIKIPSAYFLRRGSKAVGPMS
jgi:hypothetical protein